MGAVGHSQLQSVGPAGFICFPRLVFVMLEVLCILLSVSGRSMAFAPPERGYWSGWIVCMTSFYSQNEGRHAI